MSKCDPNDFKVGYGKPPEQSRFKTGQSGNPAGRPRGHLNLVTVVSNALKSKVTVTEGGRRRTKSKLEVAITQVTNKAAAGDLKALRMILGLMPILDPAGSTVQETPDLVADRELAMRIAARLSGKTEGEASHD
jgi:hypothetical protein